MSINYNQEILKLAGFPPLEIVPKVEAKIAEIIKECEHIFNEALITPTVTYDLKGHTAGQAFSNNTRRTYRIRLNAQLLWNEDYVDDMLHQVVPHEVAHVVCAQVYGKKMGHGFEWKLLMRQLGLNADRTHHYATKAARQRKRMPRPYKYTCGCPGKIFNLTKIIHRRIVNGQRRYCPDCNWQVEYQGYDPNPT